MNVQCRTGTQCHGAFRHRIPLKETTMHKGPWHFTFQFTFRWQANLGVRVTCFTWHFHFICLWNSNKSQPNGWYTVQPLANAIQEDGVDHSFHAVFWPTVWSPKATLSFLRCSSWDFTLPFYVLLWSRTIHVFLSTVSGLSLDFVKRGKRANSRVSEWVSLLCIRQCFENKLQCCQSCAYLYLSSKVGLVRTAITKMAYFIDQMTWHRVHCFVQHSQICWPHNAVHDKSPGLFECCSAEGKNADVLVFPWCV